jgi:hypothetical protein
VKRGWVGIVAAASLLGVAAPGAGQVRPGEEGIGLGLEAGVGTWHLSDVATGSARDRLGVTLGLGGSHALAEIVWAPERTAKPGLFGALGYIAWIRSGEAWMARVGFGGGAVRYDRGTVNVPHPPCPTVGCPIDGGGIALDGWAAVVGVKGSAHVALGRVSVGPWATFLWKISGVGVDDGREGPVGFGVEVRVPLRR